MDIIVDNICMYWKARSFYWNIRVHVFCHICWSNDMADLLCIQQLKIDYLDITEEQPCHDDTYYPFCTIYEENDEDDTRID